MKKIFYISVLLVLLSCTSEPTMFSEKALNDIFLNLKEESITFREILKKYKEKKIVVNVWASWCRDCREVLPDEKKLQKENLEVVFLHLSLDKNVAAWKSGIKKLGIEGEHYFMQSGRKGLFGEFLNLSWIPRYLIIDNKGSIIVFNAIKPTDKSIIEGLKK